MKEIPPPTLEEWNKLSDLHRWYIFLIVARHCILPNLPNLPAPIHFGVLASLCTFLLLPIMPHHIMAIPIAFGGGLAGALLMIGGTNAKSK
jgi:hypothetical protein